MRYREIIESGNNDGLIEAIKRDCPDILGVYQHTFKQTQNGGHVKALWRGIGEDRGEIVKSSIRGADHTDGDIAVELRRIVDESLKAAGCRAVRSNSIMTSGFMVASNYGEPYVVFPVNGCSYTWYENQQADYTLFDYMPVFTSCVPDLDEYDVYESSIKQYTDKMTPEQMYHLKQEVFAKTKEMRPVTSNIQKGIESINEFLITGSYYYSIRNDVLQNYIPELFGGAQ